MVPQDIHFPGGSDSKSICLQCRRPRFDPWVGKISWRRKWQPTPVFLPGISHGQRSLAGYSPGVAKSQTYWAASLSLSYIHTLILGACEYHLSWQKGFSRCDKVKDFEMGRLFWIIQTCPKYNPFKKHIWYTDRSGGDKVTSEAERLTAEAEEWYDHKLRTSVATRSCKRQERDSPLEPSQGSTALLTLWLGP